MQLTEKLMQVGLSRHEAQLYVLLNRDGAMTGYEAAKLSGISRSNIYPALNGLVEKGAARKIDGDVQRFIAVPVQSFCRTRKREYEQILDWIEKNMPEMQTASEPFITITGERNILHQLKNLIELSELRIYLGIDSDLLAAVHDELSAAEKKGRKVVLITDRSVDCGRATLYITKKKPGQIRLIVDSKMVMTGEIRADEQASCLYSQNNALVTLFKEAMINEIELIRLSAATPAGAVEPDKS